MEKVQRTKLKGFTLVELIVVMAIFSVLMAGALALTTPVSKMYKNTALAEKTYSYAHNIQEYIQGALEYSDSLYVYTEDKLGTTFTNDKKALAEDFRKKHYDNVVTSDDGTTSRPIKGKIYIMRLLNKADGSIPAGQITLTEYSFDGDNLTLSSPERTMLNDVYFSSSDSNYSYSYTLGASKLVTVDTPTGGDEDSVYKAVKSDVQNLDNGIDSKSLSISIILDKDPTASGYVDVTNAAGVTYRAFKSPVAVQVANLPLTNINSRNGNTGEPRVIKEGTVFRKQTTVSPGTEGGEAGLGFKNAFNTKVDFTNDIYFVYAYADELR